VNAVLPERGKRLLVLNQELSTAWYHFLHPNDGADQVLTFDLERKHLPFYARGKTNIRPTRVDLIVESPETGSFDVKLKLPGTTSATDETLQPSAEFGGRHYLAKKSGLPASSSVLGTWQLQIKRATEAGFRSLPPSAIENAYLLLEFRTS
jgi:hypothetical protein